MATKQDFTEAEWDTLQLGLTGAGMLVSMSDRDLSDSFGEASTMAKHLAGQQAAAPTELMRAVAKTKGTGFGVTASPQKVADETLKALPAAVAILAVKAPEEVEPYKGLVLGLAEAVAAAKHGVSPVENQALGMIRTALGA